MKHYLYQGTKDDFLNALDTWKHSDPDFYQSVVMGSTIISEDFGTESKNYNAMNGYLYVHRTFFPLSSVSGEFDPSQWDVLNRIILDKEDFGNMEKTIDEALITKGYLDEYTSFTNLNIKN